MRLKCSERKICPRFWLPEDNFGTILSQLVVDSLYNNIHNQDIGNGPKLTNKILFPKSLKAHEVTIKLSSIYDFWKKKIHTTINFADA